MNRRRGKTDRKHIVGLSGLALAMGMSSTAMAQTQTDTTETKASDGVVFNLKQLNAVQTAVQSSDGASSYNVPQGLIDALPEGDDASLRDILLQTPGIVLDAYNHIHVRGDYDNLQYRLNGIILPGDLSVFAQYLSPKMARSIEVMTGALPADYGLRNAGVIDITTKKYLSDGGDVSVFTGSHGEFSPSVSYGGKVNDDSFFGTVSTVTDESGLEAPNNTANPKHDRTDQALGFGYYDHFIDDTSHLTFIGGVSNQTFQIPEAAGLNSSTDGTGFAVAGQDNYSSDNIDSAQRELTQYGVVSYAKAIGYLSLSVSLNARNAQLTYRPDVDPEIAFNGIAPYIKEKDQAYGTQAEATYTLNAANAVKAGIEINDEQSTTYVDAAVLALTPGGTPVSGQPTHIIDQSAHETDTYSLYASDVWTASSNFTLIYGVRFDDLKSYRDESQFSPRVNFVWSIDPSLIVHGGYSRFFTPPPAELVTTSLQSKLTGTSGDISGANTSPYTERDNYFDLGLRKQVSKALSVGIGGYYRLAHDLVQEDQTSSPLLLVPYNFRDGRNQGIELTANYVKGPLTAYVNYTIAHATGRNEITSQFNFSAFELAYTANHWVHLDNDETHTASGGIVYKWRENRISLDGLYGSGLREDAPSGVPGSLQDKPYAQINLSLDHQFGGSQGVNGRLDVINLFDRANQIGGGAGIGIGGNQWGPRRSLYVGISKSL